MSEAPECFIFSQVPSHLAVHAFAFFRGVSQDNSHIWPRTEKEFEKYAFEGELFGVRRQSSGEFVALCYVTLNDNEWELGGIIVAPDAKRLGIASLLGRFAVAHTIAHQRPWFYGQNLIAMVHEANNEPRGLLRRIGFEQGERCTVPDDIAPQSMRRDSEGKLKGDKFHFHPTGVVPLYNWFNDEFRGVLADGRSQCVLESAGGLDTLIEALKEAASEV